MWVFHPTFKFFSILGKSGHIVGTLFSSNSILYDSLPDSLSLVSSRYSQWFGKHIRLLDSSGTDELPITKSFIFPTDSCPLLHPLSKLLCTIMHPICDPPRRSLFSLSIPFLNIRQSANNFGPLVVEKPFPRWLLSYTLEKVSDILSDCNYLDEDSTRRSSRSSTLQSCCLYSI